MKTGRLSLGIDISTQSLSAVALDIDSREKACEISLDYLTDPRLNHYGIGEDYILPPRNEGEADQPPQMFFAALDALFRDIRDAGIDLSNIAVINNSGQQHGHIYLNKNAAAIFAGLHDESAADSDLVSLLDGCLAYPSAPIWMTSDTAEQADFIREHAGGKERIIKISGSDSPLRFTGAVMRRVGQLFPERYHQTENIQLISSLVPAVLTGNSKTPLDYGNSSGTSLMDYTRREWSDTLIKAAAEGLPGSEKEFHKKLPPLATPYEIVGNIAAYFVKKYGFNPDCKIATSSGDNPQSKVLISGDLLSLGTSFVNMVSTDGTKLDMNGYANAMYDGLGRPFMFGCRTNGALVWDRIRETYGMKKDEYGHAEEALKKTPVGKSLVFWQPRDESFPVSGSFGLTRINIEPGLGSDYAGIIESSLASVYYHSKGFTAKTDEPLYVTGGATGSDGIMRRVAAIWNRKVVPVEQGGAALGAAVAGVYGLFKFAGEDFDIEKFSAAVLKREKKISPLPEDVAAIHNPGGYLERFAAEEEKLLAANPL